MLLRGPAESLGARDRGHDLDVEVGEEARERVAQEPRVLDDDYPHGITAVTRVGPPDGLDDQRAAERSDAIAPGEAGAGRLRAADAVVAHLDNETPSSRTRDSRVRGAAVAGDVRERLGDDEIRRGLGLPTDARPEPELSVTGTGEWAAREESAASRPRSVRTAGWMPRARSRISASASLASSCALVTSSAASSWEPPPRAAAARGRGRPPGRRAAPGRRRRSRSICRRSSLAEATARSRCSVLRVAARSSSPRVGPSKAHEQRVEGDDRAHEPRRHEEQECAAAHDDRPLPGGSMRFPSQKTSPRLCSGIAKYQIGALTHQSATDHEMTATRKLARPSGKAKKIR